MPFKSKDQAKTLFKYKPKVAKEIAESGKRFKDLPNKVAAKKPTAKKSSAKSK